MTINEILEAIKADPKLKTDLFAGIKDEFKGQAQALGLVIRTPEEDKTFIDTQLASKVDTQLEEKFDKKYKDRLDDYDRLIAEVTGVAKREADPVDRSKSEKTSDYLKRAIVDFEKRHRTADGARVTELERLLAEKDKDYKGRIKDLESKMFNQAVDLTLESDLKGRQIVIPAHLKTDKERQKYEQTQRDMIKNQFRAQVAAKEVEGKGLMYLKGETALLNNDGTPKTAAQILDEDFGFYFVPVGAKGEGSGGIPPQGGNGFSKTDDVHNFLRGKGLVAGTPAYMEQFDKLTKEHKVDVATQGSEQQQN